MDKSKNIIIIVDDDKEDQKLVTMALKHGESNNMGLFDVISVSSPEEMISFIKKEDMHKNFYLVILMDIKMPGKDGFDALEMIREDPKLAHLPVVIFSSTSSPDDIDRSYRMGANSFISKKTDYDDLIRTMKVFKEYWIETVKKPFGGRNE